ncbi:uncharacterized protein [Lepeophtheirus salmonis]|uniref:uncharacterized protein n=1 Tax=Lepeophtheirus salmonis TaxID=72036 RepID=UPI001AE83907|nr:BUD13 homolog [Lepeophtheirus salmonis]
MSGQISKVDYLKKYLSKTAEDAPDSCTDLPEKKKKKKKKKDKKLPLKTPSMKIIDNDVFFGGSEQKDNLDEEDCDEETAIRLGRGEELPSVAGIIDSRPMDVIIKEKLSTGEWKPLEGWNKDNAPSGMLKVPQDIKEEPLSPRSQGSPEHIREDRRKQRHDSSDEDDKRGQSSFHPRRRHDSSDEDSTSESRRNSSQKSVHSADAVKRAPSKKRDGSEHSDSRERSSYRGDSMPRRRKRHDSSDDSPPSHLINQDQLQRKRHDSSDESPPRKQRPRIKKEPTDHDDLSPPRKIKQEPDSDASPPRRCPIKEELSSDASPPRRSMKQEKRTYDSDESPPRNKSNLVSKTLDGKKAGLQDGKTLKREMDEIRNKERTTFSKLSNDVSGRGAETKVRGRLKEKEELKRKKKKENEIPDEVKEKYTRWSKGIKQLEITQARIKEDLHEMDKPLARSKDDKDLDEYLRNIERDEDPMLKYIRKKKVKIVEKNGGPQYPKYKGPTPFPNRFQILPGYRWDGVDRSNGFEKKLVEAANSKKARSEDALKWSQEDM